MEVKLLCYAQLREAFGSQELVLPCTPGTTVAALTASLLTKDNAAPLRGLPFRYAVNETFVAESHVLQHGDELCLIPPVAGG